MRLLLFVLVSLAGLQALAPRPAAAQGFFDRFPLFDRSERYRFRAPPFFDRGRQAPQRQQAPADYSHAPAAPKRSDTDKKPTTTVVVMGDSMADWLAYGLEQIYKDDDTADIGIVRQDRTRSGLINGDDKDEDWPKIAREFLAKEQVSAVVMMIGRFDRRPIRGPATKPHTERKDEKTQAKDAGKLHAFRSEEWVALYTRRIDEMIAALKSRGVPVFWVGLPPIYGNKATDDLAFLNTLFRAEAEKAGITYVDVWDGFVNGSGKYVVFGPDFEGQRRRLRARDGVHFTQAGALKLAHYVERDIRRVLANRLVPVALPSGPGAMLPGEREPGQPRPLAGPVFPLVAMPVPTDQLMGGSGVRPPPHDALANRVLVKGDPLPAPAGRVDDFHWPRRDIGADSDTATDKPPATGAPAAGQTSPAPGDARVTVPTAQPTASVSVPAVAPLPPEPPPAADDAAAVPAAPAKPAAGKPTAAARTSAEPRTHTATRPRPVARRPQPSTGLWPWQSAPRPPAPVGQASTGRRTVR